MTLFGADVQINEAVGRLAREIERDRRGRTAGETRAREESAFRTRPDENGGRESRRRVAPHESRNNAARCRLY